MSNRSARPSSRRSGFTLPELIVVTAIVAILAALAIPNLRNMILRARAAEVAGDLEVVRLAAAQYNSDMLTWPAETGTGVVPDGLATYLPANFDFARDGYSLDFESWTLPGGLPGDPSTTRLIGVSVVADDPALGDALVELLGSAIVMSVDDTHTVVIDRS